MELSEACDKLAKLIEEDPVLRVRSGTSIEMFIISLNDGETPAMALAMVKNYYVGE